MKKIILSFIFFVAMVGMACAMPTPTVSIVASSPYVQGTATATGFFLYWCEQTSPISCTDASGKPVGYNNTNRFDLGFPATITTVGINEPILTADPNAISTICFRATAYDAIKNESAFSNEACGFVGGLKEPTGEVLK